MASLENTLGKFFNKVHVGLYRKSGGKIWRTMLGFPVLILTTTGRKSGKERSVPVVYFNDGNDYIIAAAQNGLKPNPSWYYNITSNNNVTIEIDGKTHQATAEILEGNERHKFYEMMKSQGENFVRYEEKTAGIREIPVIRLSVK